MAIIAKEDGCGTKAVFLDRDGVLDVDTGYISRPEQVQWVPGAKTALARLHKLGYAVFVVTNQSGIARGYYTVEDMKVLHAFMAKEIEKPAVRLPISITVPTTRRKGPSRNWYIHVLAVNPSQA